MPSLCSASQSQSQIFTPYRAIGYVCNEVPFSLQTKGVESFVTTCVGTSFHVYNCSKLNLLFVGQPQSNAIRALATSGDVVFTAVNNSIQLWKRGKLVHTLEDHKSPLFLLYVFGDVLISVCEENILKIWNLETLELFSDMPFDLKQFHISGVIHPSTYLDKLLVYSRQGTLQLHNVKSQKLVHEFRGWGNAVISSCQSPAVDVVAFGLENGEIILHNLLYDRTVLRFSHNQLPVTSLTFRMDGEPIMISGSQQGDLAVWNLEKKRLICTLQDAHDDSVASVQFLPSQPLFVSSGADNSLKMWIFDQCNDSPRLLRSRSGHSKPPTIIKYYGDSGHILLSAGLDRSLRYFSTIADQQARELSQGSIARKSRQLSLQSDALKFPSIRDFAAESLREKDWDHLLTCHSGDPICRTWSVEAKAVGKHQFSVPESPSVNATAVAVSACGNFGLVGYQDGSLARFNMQSGALRGHKALAHKKEITGIVSDSLNKFIFTSSLDGSLSFWRFSDFSQIGIISLQDIMILKLCFHRESSLLATVGSDFNLRLFDIETQKLVRIFKGHSARITDICFSPDSRWLLSSSMDMTIRTWDIPSGKILDLFRVPQAPVSLSFSPTGDFLCSAHVDTLGLSLWANKAAYSHISFRPVSDDCSAVSFPATAVEADSDEIERFMNSVPLLNDQITLSSEPRSKWTNLLNLDLIKERNKPKEAPVASPQAPFFLPTLPGNEMNFVFDTSAGDNQLLNLPTSSRVVNFGELSTHSPFVRSLSECYERKDYSVLVDMIKSMSPSSIDFELRTLTFAKDFLYHCMFLSFLLSELPKNMNFEMLQAILKVYLTIHGDLVLQNATLCALLKSLLAYHESMWESLEEKMHHILCMIDFVKHAAM